MINRIVYTSFLLGASFASTDAQVNTPPNIVLIYVTTWDSPIWVATEVKSRLPT